MKERWNAWFNEKLSRYWMPLTLLTALAALFSYSLRHARWVSDSSGMDAAIGWGLLFGFLLAISRFKPGWAAAYGLFFSFNSALNAAGSLLPSLSTLFRTPFWYLVQQINIRVTLLGLRMGTWLQQIVSGQKVEDTGLFVLLVAWLGWCSTAWLVWAVLHRRRALEGLLPYAALMGVNITLSGQKVGNLWLFVVVAGLLIAYDAYVQKHWEWDFHRIGYPSDLVMEWAIAAVLITMLAGGVARVSPYVTTPEGWREMRGWFERARTQSEETASRLFANVNPPEMDGDGTVSIQSPNLESIGAPLPDQHQTVMWVKVSDPPPPPPEVEEHTNISSTPRHYWRSTIYDRYTGRGWVEALHEVGDPPFFNVNEPSQGHYLLEQEYEIPALHADTLFSVNEPVAARGGARFSTLINDSSAVLRGVIDRYTVQSWASKLTANELMSSGTEYPQEIRLAYLQLPATLPERIRTLSAKIVAGAENNYDRTLLIQNYLRANMNYDLTVDPPAEDRDVVDYFLFESQTGFCTYYASAMTIMLRTQGIPARVASGYAMGEYDYEKKAYRVSASSAHSWVEVYFPPYGWVEFEPTAVFTPFTYPLNIEPGTAQTPAPEPKTSPTGVYLKLAWYVAGFLLALAVLIFYPRLRRSVKSEQHLRGQIIRLYRQARRQLAWAGLPGPGSLTPDEYLDACRAGLEKEPDLYAAMQLLTGLYLEAVYSEHLPGEDKINRARLVWERGIIDWLRLVLRRKLRHSDRR